LENLHTEASIAETVKIEQAEKIKEETKKREIEIATNFIKIGLNNEQISSGTGLTVEDIQNLRNELNVNK
jgi:hypothetical protein